MLLLYFCWCSCFRSCSYRWVDGESVSEFLIFCFIKQVGRNCIWSQEHLYIFRLRSDVTELFLINMSFKTEPALGRHVEANHDHLCDNHSNGFAHAQSFLELRQNTEFRRRRSSSTGLFCHGRDKHCHCGTVIQNTLKIVQKCSIVPQAQERVSAAERANEASSAEQVNEWAARAKEQADERLAHYWCPNFRFWIAVLYRKHSP